MKLFMDMDETLIKSVPAYNIDHYQITQKPKFTVKVRGVDVHVFVRPDIQELADKSFSVFSAGGSDYVNAVIGGLEKHLGWSVESIHSRGNMSLYPNVSTLYKGPCILIDERESHDWVVMQKLNVLPNGKHIKIKPFDIQDGSVKVSDEDPGMHLRECLALVGI